MNKLRLAIPRQYLDEHKENFSFFNVLGDHPLANVSISKKAAIEIKAINYRFILATFSKKDIENKKTLEYLNKFKVNNDMYEDFLCFLIECKDIENKLG